MFELREELAANIFSLDKYVIHMAILETSPIHQSVLSTYAALYEPASVRAGIQEHDFSGKLVTTTGEALEISTSRKACTNAQDTSRW